MTSENLNSGGVGGGSSTSSSWPSPRSSGFQWPLRPIFGPRPQLSNVVEGTTGHSLRQDIHCVIQGLGPLVEQSQNIGLGTWLRHTHNVRTPDQRQPQTLRQQHSHVLDAGGANASNERQEVVVSMEGDNGSPSEGSNDNSTGGGQPGVSQYMDPARQSPELRTAIMVIEKYMPFLLILLAKLIFDHKLGILVLFGLVITFFHANSVIRREVGKQGKRSLRCLLSVIINLLMCIFFLLFFVFETEKLYYNLIFLPPYIVHQPSIWDLLFVVAITDFILKLVTIICKAIVVALPGCVLPFQKKGKYYLFIEVTSQSYRSLTPIQPWIVYLLEAYEGFGKLVGIGLCAAYIFAKATHLIRGFWEWKLALCKLMQSVTYGCVPTSEQTETAGNLCPICQDHFRQPTVLSCKHIFCEDCVSMWFDRERTCPMCRAQIADDPSWRDGSTTFFLQLF